MGKVGSPDDEVSKKKKILDIELEILRRSLFQKVLHIHEFGGQRLGLEKGSYCLGLLRDGLSVYFEHASNFLVSVEQKSRKICIWVDLSNVPLYNIASFLCRRHRAM